MTCPSVPNPGVDAPMWAGTDGSRSSLGSQTRLGTVPWGGGDTETGLEPRYRWARATDASIEWGTTVKSRCRCTDVDRYRWLKSVHHLPDESRDTFHTQQTIKTTSTQDLDPRPLVNNDHVSVLSHEMYVLQTGLYTSWVVFWNRWVTELRSTRLRRSRVKNGETWW